MPESNTPMPARETEAPPSAPVFMRILAWPPLAAFAFAVFFVIGLSVGLHLLVDRSAWHLQLANSFRVAVLAYTAVQMLPIALAVGIVAALASRGRRRIAAPAALLLVLVFLALFMSWGMFWATGQFLDGDALAFGMASPGSMLHHVLQLSPWVVIGVPLAAGLSGLGLVYAARRMPRFPVPVRLLLLSVLVGGYLYASSTNAAAETYLLAAEVHLSHPEGGNTVALGDLMAELREDRSGPVAHLMASRRRGSELPAMSPDLPVSWRDRTEAWVAPAPAQPYNVVLLIVESLRSDELEAYGASLDVMPAVDAVADDAAVFFDHYAVASHSSYSAVSPVSGQYPLRDERLHIYPENPTYPRVLLYDLLAPRGYRTAIISSQNERWGGMANFLASATLDHFFHAETYDGPTYAPEEDGGFSRFTESYGRAGKIDDAVTITEAIRWIGSGQSKPFFVYINLQNSHVPYPVPLNAPTPFGPRKTSFPIRFNYFPVDSAEVVRGVYRNALHYVDAQVGRLVQHLKENGTWDRTIFLVMGDHGQAFFEHGFAAHGNELYEELLRTPLIIRAPGLEPGVRRGLAQHVDIAPTVLDLLGLPPHPGFQGVSLLAPRRSFAYAIVQTPMANQYSISHGGFKLVLDARRGGEVFRDLGRDPLELRDWMSVHPERATELRERLQTWRAAQLKYYGNPLLQGETYAPVLAEPVPAQDSAHARSP